MPYDELADLVEKNADQIRIEVRDEVQKRVPNYIGDNVENLRGQLLETIQVIANYIRSGDVEEFREYIRNLAKQRLQRYEGQDFSEVARTIMRVIKRVVDRELTGPENYEARAQFQQRLDGLNMTGAAIIGAERAKKAPRKRSPRKPKTPPQT